MIPFKIKSAKETAEQCAALKYGYSIPVTLATTPKRYAIILNGIPYTTNNALERIGKLVYNTEVDTLELIDCKAYQEYLTTNN